MNGEAMKSAKIATIFLASGKSVRFGQSKLTYPVDGGSLIERCFAHFPFELFLQNIVVTNQPQIAVQASLLGLSVVENPLGEGLSDTIRLGIAALQQEIDACMFCVCDQPFVQRQSIKAIVDAYQSQPEHIICLGKGMRRGNPVIFPKSLFTQLQSLRGDEGGTVVIQRHQNLLQIVDCIDERELFDVDTMSDAMACNLDYKP